ncbi:MAG: GNAT family N-acetyltransferase [Proteobacteria bacterium]|nr:GNAT family N-acetyltransferase [Pseudomonadota bacterium]
MNITYRLFNIDEENKSKLFDLYRNVYGDAAIYMNRWAWEVEQHPDIKDIKIFIAECENLIVGASMRIPLKIKANDKVLNSAFSINSMVHSDFRGKGIIQNLYTMSFNYYPVLYSKSTAPGMYKILIKMGYRIVEPDTVLTSILSITGWSLWRLGWYKPEIRIDDIMIDQKKGFNEIEKFGAEFDEFWDSVSPQYPNIVVKNAAFMNWRYFRIPQKKYRIFYKKSNGRITVMAVLGQSGTTAKIVDILWDRGKRDELLVTIDYIKKICRKCGFLKVLCWTPMVELRDSLKKKRFIDSGERDNLNVMINNDAFESFSVGSDFHFVLGDGDSEYLS